MSEFALGQRPSRIVQGMRLRMMSIDSELEVLDVQNDQATIRILDTGEEMAMAVDHLWIYSKLTRAPEGTKP